MKIDNVDLEALKNVEIIDCSIRSQMQANQSERMKIWERLASQFKFDIKKDSANVNTDTGEITISWFDKKEGE